MTIFKILSWDDVRHRPFKKMTGPSRRVVAHNGVGGGRAKSPGRTPIRDPDSPAPGPDRDPSPTPQEEDASKTSTFDVWCRVLMALLLYTVSDKKEFLRVAYFEKRLVEVCELGLNKSELDSKREFVRKLQQQAQTQEDLATVLNNGANVENSTIMLFWTLFVAGILAVVLRVYLS